MTDSDLHAHDIVDDEQWITARLELLTREKRLTHLRDEVNTLRRALPWRRVKPNYIFQDAQGKLSLEELFGKHSQLAVYHFMLGPDWEAGCPSCSFWADHFDGMLPHLQARDTAFAVVSRAPIDKIVKYAKRMGWGFRWVSSRDNSFNQDFEVSFTEPEIASEERNYNFGTQKPMSQEMPGASIFLRKGSDILHTYSTFSRGLDILNGSYHWLDLTPKGRNETQLPWTMAWVKRHDEYESP